MKTKIAETSAAGPRAMSRVLKLFDLLARNRGGLTLSAISSALDVPKSTFLASLRALVADGFLLAEGNLYRLGPNAFRLAGSILSSWSMPDIVRHYVRHLASETGESVGFAIADWEIGQVIYTEAVNSIQPVHYAMRAGLRAPIYASASGRVLLAHAAPDRRRDYLARTQFKALTPVTKTTPASIEETCDSVRRLGYAASFGEMLRDTASIAVPVFDASDAVIGALMVAAPLDRMRSTFRSLLTLVIQSGRKASGLPDIDVPASDFPG